MLFSLSLILFLTLASGQNPCESGRGHYVFKRILHFNLESEVMSSPPPDKETLQKYLGSCKTVDVEAQKMITFMASFGFNLTDAAKAPFVTHETKDYKLTTLSVPESMGYRILMASKNDVAEYLNTPVHAAGWVLHVKNDYQGPKGLIMKNTPMVFGNYRFRLGGRDQCVQITRMRPPLSGGVLDIGDVQLFHEEWGLGASRGLDTYNEDRTYRSLNHISTFPPDAPF